MTIRPIRTEADHEAALDRIEELWGAAPDTPQRDELDILIDLAEQYEDRHHPTPQGDPIDVLKIHMDAVGKRQADLADLLGSAPRASEVLQRKRRLNLPMIQKLHAEWGMPIEPLVRAYELEAA